MNSRGLLAVVLVSSAAAALAGGAAAQLSAWRPLGPDGASVLALASPPADPAVIYAGGYAALFRSLDGGLSFERIGRDIPARDIGALAIAADGTVCAGTYGAGVYRSTDGGATFSAANAGLETASIFVLVSAPATGLWAGTSDAGVFLSTDDGASWEGRSNGLLSLEVHDLLLAGADTLYAATRAGVHVSTDGGASWSEQNQGLTNLETMTLARGPGYLYVGTTTISPAESGVYRSSDGGASWELVAAGLSNTRVTDLLIDPDDPDLLWAATQTHPIFAMSGVYRSTDAGTSWSLVPGNPSARDVRVLARVGGAVLAGAAGEPTALGGLFRSLDGQSFTRFDRGLVVMRCRAVATHPDGELLLGAIGSFREPGGAYRSSDGGATWSGYSAGGLRSTVLALRIATPTLRYAGTAGGVWKWTPAGGGTWSQTALATGVVQDLVQPADAADSLRLWAATASAGVQYSADGGASFAARNTGLASTNVRALALDPAAPEVLFAGTDSGVFRSTDGGLAWESHSLGLPPDVRALVFDGAGRLFAATAGGVFELDGASWVERNAGLSDLDVRSLALYRDQRYAATPSGVQRQEGATSEAWTPFNSGLQHLDVRAVHADSARGALSLFAATEGGGLFLADEPTPVLVAGVAVTSAPGRVEIRFATTGAADLLGFLVERRLAGEPGFARRTPDLLTGGPEYVFVDDDPALVAGLHVSYRLRGLGRDGGTAALVPVAVTIAAPGERRRATLAAHPNPFATETWFAAGAGAGATIRVFDVAGRLVRSLAVPAADAVVGWDGRGEGGAPVAAGIYLAELRGARGTATVRVVRVR